MNEQKQAAEKRARKFLVSGRVQGVGYRFFAQRAATELGICGYTKNLYDGRVEVLAIGDEAQFEGLRAKLARGPRFARVDGVEESDATLSPQGLAAWEQGFSIED